MSSRPEENLDSTVIGSKDLLAEQFIDHLDNGKNLSPLTVRAYKHSLKKFRSFRPEVSWIDATADDFRAYLLNLMKHDLSRSTIRLSFAALRSFYNYLNERNIVNSNVLKMKPLKKSNVTVYFSIICMRETYSK